jgi:hypothetical protein
MVEGLKTPVRAEPVEARHRLFQSPAKEEKMK